jgi:hypothetical protein
MAFLLAHGVEARQSVFGDFFGLSLNLVILPFFMRFCPLAPNHYHASPARDGAIATSTDAGRRCATDAFHEGWAQRTDRTGIGNMWGFREIIEIPFIDDDP